MLSTPYDPFCVVRSQWTLGCFNWQTANCFVAVGIRVGGASIEVWSIMMQQRWCHAIATKQHLCSSCVVKVMCFWYFSDLVAVGLWLLHCFLACWFCVLLALRLCGSVAFGAWCLWHCLCKLVVLQLTVCVALCPCSLLTL